MSETIIPERLVNTATDGAQRPGDIAVLSGGRNAAAWIDDGAGGVAKLRVFGADGSALSGELSLGSATEVMVRPLGDGFAAVWIVQVGRQQVDIIAQRFDATGQAIGGPQTLETVDLRNTPILDYRATGLDLTGLSDGGYAVGWTSGSFDSSGRASLVAHVTALDAAGAVENRFATTIVSGRGAGHAANVTVAELSDHTLLASWWFQDAALPNGPPTPSGQFVQRLDLAGRPVGPELRLDPSIPSDGGPVIIGSNGLSMVGLAGGQVGFAWISGGSVWVSLYPSANLGMGNLTGRTQPVRVAEEASGGEPQLALLPDGRLVVGWSAGGDVMAQVLTSAGQPDGAAFRLGTTTAGVQDDLRLAVGPDGVLAAMWRDDSGLGGDASGTGVKVALTAFELNFQGGSGIDRLTGGALGDRLSGLANDDVLFGGGGADTLDGGMGGDSLSGGAGDDRIVGGLNVDFVTYADAPAAVHADISALRATGGAGNDALIEVEALYGSAFNDTLTGNYLSNLLVGGAGDDTIDPYSGSDYLDGGAGADTLILVGTVRDYFVAGLNGQDARLIGPYGTSEVHGFERVVIGGQSLSWTEFTNQAFNGLRYIASNTDLIASIGTDVDRARQHWINTGRPEGRPLDTFDPLRYAASNPDLLAQFGVDAQALARHWITTGFAAGRSATSFDALQYGAAHADLLRAFGADEAALTRHYAVAGAGEGRAVRGFDPLLYGASNDDLARLFGTDANGLFQHWIRSGAYEFREPAGFDKVAYVLSHPELVNAGVTFDTAINHWLTTGADQGLRGDELFGREQIGHGVTAGVTTGTLKNFTTSGRPSADRDWFHVTAGPGGSLGIDVRGLDSGAGTLSDPRLEVYDANGRLVASDEDGGVGRDASLQLSGIVAGGTYYIVVRSAGEAEGTYELEVSGAQAGAPEGWVV
jgi:Ca2+-binding RTX toxin-like protein